MRVEHEYTRRGAWVYLAALDVHHCRIFGRCEQKNGIIPFDSLVDQVMTRLPYIKALRVFWIVNNGPSHRGLPAQKRLQNKYPRLVLVHTPVHASWLNQVEIYFSILKRKVLTPNNFPDLASLAERILEFQYYWESIGQPFQWNFSRDDLNELLRKIRIGNPPVALSLAS